MEEENKQQDFGVGELVSILFTAGDEVSKRDLGKVFLDDLDILIEDARESLRPLGLVILSDGDSLQIVVAPEYNETVADWQKTEGASPLSSAAIETLATVCYLGSARKTDIDFIRGVNSYFTLRKLSMRGMLSVDSNGVYTPTIEALGNLGVERIDDLPDWETVNRTLREQLHAQSVDVVE